MSKNKPRLELVKEAKSNQEIFTTTMDNANSMADLLETKYDPGEIMLALPVVIASYINGTGKSITAQIQVSKDISAFIIQCIEVQENLRD